MRYLHLLVTVLLATPLAAQDLPAPGDYRQAVTRATGLYIDAMATVSESIEALVAAVARRAWTMRSIVMAAAEAYFRTSPASCKGQEAVTGAGDRCFSGSQARSRRPDPGDLRHLENSLFRCGPVLSRETRL